MRIGLVLIATVAVLFAGCSGVRGNVCRPCGDYAAVASPQVGDVVSERVIRRGESTRRMTPTARTADVRTSNFDLPATPSVTRESMLPVDASAPSTSMCPGGVCGIPDACCPGGVCGIPDACCPGGTCGIPNPFKGIKLPSFPKPCSPCSPE